MARALLAVFVPVMLMSLTHIHESTFHEEMCVDCVNHLPHAGHITGHQISLDECLLCQFISVPYTTSGVVALLVVALTFFTLLVGNDCVLLATFQSSRSVRAPPMV